MKPSLGRKLYQSTSGFKTSCDWIIFSSRLIQLVLLAIDCSFVSTVQGEVEEQGRAKNMNPENISASVGVMWLGSRHSFGLSQ